LPTSFNWEIAAQFGGEIRDVVLNPIGVCQFTSAPDRTVAVGWKIQ
jgi:hypothetical protein